MHIRCFVCNDSLPMPLILGKSFRKKTEGATPLRVVGGQTAYL